MNNPFAQLNNLYNKPLMLPGEVSQVDHLSPEDKTLLRRIGLTSAQVQRDLLADAQIFFDRYNIYHQVEKALEHPIVGAATELYANYCCLTGDTRIPLLDGRTLTIREILEEHKAGKENWVYSCDTSGKPQPAKIVNAVKQKHTPKTFRVWLDNGKYVDASDNHKFIKRDGSLCRTDELVVGDSLMPLHRTVSKNGYELVWDVVKGNWESTHKMVAQYSCDVNLKEANKGKSVADDSCLIVHHVWDGKGFDKRNNNPSMVKVITSKEHRAIHNAILVERWNNPEARKVQGEKLRVLNKDPEFRRKSKEGHNTPEYKAKMEKFWDGQIGDVVRGAKISRGRRAWVDSTTPEERQTVAREIRTCAAPGCDITFECKITSARKYCCSGHANKGNTYNSPKKGRLVSPREVKVCGNVDCDNTFTVVVGGVKRFCSTSCANKDVETNKKRGRAISKAKLLAPSYNHKITKIECIGEQVVYDIEVTGSHLFGLDVGIYISNTVFSPMHNATIWVTSESPTYQKELTKLMDRIGIEEKIFDWAFTAGSYGDMFVKVNGIPGQGVISIDDSDHPINISRVDHEGVLIGYYKTPVGQAGDQQRLMAPWEYVHFRLLGGKKQRPQFGDQSYAEYRTVHLLTGLRSKQVTTRYGTSVIMNALAIYRRLRLAEDSLLIARLSRGLIRYVWKLKVDSANMEAVGELIDQYSRVLREARSMDTSAGSPNFDSKENPMACLRGDTEISLCNGQDISIKELVDNSEDYIGKYVWSINPETLHVESKRILKAQKTRLNTQLVRVHLDNDKYVDCTPDHRFMLRDGSYREAQYLKEKDSLMPFYTKVPEKGLSGYKCIYDPGDNKHHYAHKLIVGKLPRGFVPHHLDFNKLNNDPSNFVICTRHVHHTIYHGKHTFETIEKIKKNQVAWLKDKTKETFPYLVEAGEQHSKFMLEFYKTERGQRAIEKGLETRMERYGTLSTTPVGEAHLFYGKTWEETLGLEETAKRKQELVERMTGANNPSKKPEVCKKISEHHKKNPPNPKGRTPIVKAFRTKWCECGCGEQFIQDSRYPKRFMPGHNKGNQAKVVEGCLLNHKVVFVEWLSEKEDTYDISVDGNHNFALTNGIFVHNSIEDIFIPVWDNVGDLTFDKIGGETDIRWIRDIEDLRQQLAAALRTPLPLLGAWLKEATGPLGSQAIEKVDINFARMARKLQRTVRTGIKRICQIHLAYMNMDPDPNLFDVQMPEMSTAEEESLKESLKDGMEVVSSMMEVVSDIVADTDKELDKIEIFNYLNEKILKLEDFDLKEYLVAKEEMPIEEPPIEEYPEEEQAPEQERRDLRDSTFKSLRKNVEMCDKRKARMVQEMKVKKLLESSMAARDTNRIFKKPCLFDSDLQSFVPTQIHDADGKVNEKAVAKLERSGGWLGIERCMEKWQELYGNAKILDEEVDSRGKWVESVEVESEVQGQLALPFKEEE